MLSLLLFLVERLKDVTYKVGTIQAEMGMAEPATEFVKANCRPGMMEVCFAWAQGKPFLDVTQMTDVQEGSIVRCITRLQEVCKEVKNAARVIGSPILFQKAETAVNLIKRDIVFAASLCKYCVHLSLIEWSLTAFPHLLVL